MTKFYVDTKTELSDERLVEIGAQFFGRYSSAQGIVTGIRRVPEEEHSASVFELRTLSRLYDFDYERGDPLPWMDFSEYFEHLGFDVHYFGDCGEFEDVGTLLDEKRRAAIRKHYAAVGTDPYFKRPAKD